MWSPRLNFINSKKLPTQIEWLGCLRTTGATFIMAYLPPFGQKRKAKRNLSIELTRSDRKRTIIFLAKIYCQQKEPHHLNLSRQPGSVITTKRQTKPVEKHLSNPDCYANCIIWIVCSQRSLIVLE